MGCRLPAEEVDSCEGTTAGGREEAEEVGETGIVTAGCTDVTPTSTRISLQGEVSEAAADVVVGHGGCLDASGKWRRLGSRTRRCDEGGVRIKRTPHRTIPPPPGSRSSFPHSHACPLFTYPSFLSYLSSPPPSLLIFSASPLLFSSPRFPDLALLSETEAKANAIPPPSSPLRPPSLSTKPTHPVFPLPSSRLCPPGFRSESDSSPIRNRVIETAAGGAGRRPEELREKLGVECGRRAGVRGAGVGAAAGGRLVSAFVDAHSPSIMIMLCIEGPLTSRSRSTPLPFASLWLDGRVRERERVAGNGNRVCAQRSRVWWVGRTAPLQRVLGTRPVRTPAVICIAAGFRTRAAYRDAECAAGALVGVNRGLAGGGGQGLQAPRVSGCRPEGGYTSVASLRRRARQLVLLNPRWRLKGILRQFKFRSERRVGGGEQRLGGGGKAKLWERVSDEQGGKREGEA
ncbi:hypothetical protein B0H11DRAFT_1921482 [Mycena galericulata]|nr:hypothetical protein B0H11DRAFT_1921482 [Mycena galericulata]